jgi:predicted metal-dependent phosphoesterase TrpH
LTPPYFDLQTHSVCSDGVLEPADVIEQAAMAGIRLTALSDHNTIAGVDEAPAAGTRCGIEVVPATEVTVVDDVAEDLHVLAYRIDHRDAALLDLLAASRHDRDARAGRMADALRAQGWALDERALRARSAAGQPVGRPHLAQAVFTEPHNAARLAEEPPATSER